MCVDSLFITELFASLQGEGPLMGQPAAFVRLSGCLKPYCHFCDTTHSFEKGEAISVQSLFEQVVELDQKLVVITGGEPFLQWDSGLEQFEDGLLLNGMLVQYETSGRVKVPKRGPGVKVICSPKQVGDFSSDVWSFLPENIESVDCFKFVYADNADQILAFIDKYEIENHKVFIMPEGATREVQLGRLAEVWEWCVAHKFNLAPRLHVLAFDDKVGV